MRNREVFIKIAQAAVSKEYTEKQLSEITISQLKTDASLTDKQSLEAEKFLPGIKRLCLLDLQKTKNDAKIAAFTSQITAWLDINFPEWKIKQGTDRDKPFVTVWLDGNPDESQAVKEVARG